MHIFKYPYPILKYKSKNLLKVDQFILDCIKEMNIILDQYNGIGLAANQVNLPYRMFITKIPQIPTIINPVIYEYGGKSEKIEGCLSIPNLSLKIKRSQKIKLNAFDEFGNEINIKLEGLNARIVLHEYSHLNGMLIIDEISDLDLKQESILSKLIENFKQEPFDKANWENTNRLLVEERC